MSRATNAPASRERRRRVLEETKGFRGPRSKNIRQAMEARDRARRRRGVHAEEVDDAGDEQERELRQRELHRLRQPYLQRQQELFLIERELLPRAEEGVAPSRDGVDEHAA